MLQTKNLNSINAPSHRGFLSWIQGPQIGIKEIDEFLTIGRSFQDAFDVNDSYMSQRHFRIERRDGTFLLRDLKSRNGTFLNGARILEALLSDGDVVRAGNSEFRFQFESSTSQNIFSSSLNTHWSSQLKRIPSIGQSELPVLILGESGTGKEVVAHQIHKDSKRSQGPLISVNCSALGESLIESELFGHIKGSFTGATHDRKGAFESARGGTLFLDEIGDLPLHLQPKLLRALENQEIRPVGSDKATRTDVRLIAATHKNLKEDVTNGRFRSDLFFRINVVQVNPPALRQRLEDFESLFYFFCKKYRVSFSHGAIEKLKTHNWPGNIRELNNCVARGKALFAGQQVREENVSELVEVLETSPAHTLSKVPIGLKDLERRLIFDCLAKNHGNQRKTAQDLGIPKSTLHDRVKNYGINIDDFKNQSKL